ncbi:hypothetical protein [Flavobacterium geliluteum]|uniref:Uncharacterized protein n=1 Tax=Flavobacterium geliluteum TaxID=2816120 RepID=A0A940X9V6_9FLAO|nr:hypothetical protein [Flavobacterium geliluteum]MBP4139171.1 hypothetical protein [Flavobacterium geliluteum]
MSTNATLWLSLAVAGILVVATLDDAKAPEVIKEEDKPKTEPKKVVL